MSARILTIAQQKGGAGKTTITAQLAVAFSRQGHRVALVDIDPQGSLGGWFAVRQERLGDANLLQLSDVSGWRLGNELNRLRADYDLVLIDSPPHAETEAKAAIRAADLVLVPLQPSPMDLWATQPTIDLALGEGRDMICLLNRVPPRGKLVAKIRADLAEQNLPVLATGLGNRTAFAATMMEGLGVAERGGNKTASDEILALTIDIGRRLQKAEKAA
ncbi:ParA family partition ATPase [Magnetospira sp. QH-2]|uniref:ParA family partition ATPase n=1 Tax=Magnetospira sp. (strain QH-2) TaxID=1288970 RepID=UPI0005FA4233|nr:ParA family partition ATPase [Magnetospira sp. QH-2]